MDNVSEQNRSLAEQLDLTGTETSWDTRSVNFEDSASSRTSRPTSSQSLTGIPRNSARASLQRPHSVAGSIIMALSNRSFELILGQSRVYSRTEGYEIDRSSSRTSTAPTNSWSMLSLSNLSTAAACRLPISLNDINKIAPGSTFARLLKEYDSVGNNMNFGPPTTPPRDKSASRIIRMREQMPLRSLQDSCVYREPDSSHTLPTFT